MIVSTVASRFASNRTSRLVTIPTNPLLSTTGIPEISFSFISAIRSRMVAVTGMVKGSLTTPLSYFLTKRTSRSCFSTLMFLWITPSPPSCAIAIARRASVTVSMADDTSGIFNAIERVKLDSRLTDLGRTVECAGRSRTSSNVKASSAIRNIRLPLSAKRHYTDEVRNCIDRVKRDLEPMFCSSDQSLMNREN